MKSNFQVAASRPSQPCRNLLDGKPAILICSCREEECWPFMVEIEEQDIKVIWKNFLQPYRDIESKNHWEYDKFGSFEFVKSEYQKELKKLKALATIK